MPTLTFNIRYARGSQQLISAADIRRNYLWGIDLSKYGVAMSDDTLDFHIQAAITQLEGYLNIKFQKQVIKERFDFKADDWKVWGYIKVSYPLVCPVSLIGFLGTVNQVEYPVTWMSARQTNDGHYQRLLYLVPNTNSTQSELVTYNGLLPNINYFSNMQIPNYWEVTYVTGFDKLPLDILNVVGKLATINILVAAQDALLYGHGVASQTISLDGLSQTLSTVANSQTGIFGPRIKQYSTELWGDGRANPGELNRLKDQYSNFIWGVC